MTLRRAPTILAALLGTFFAGATISLAAARHPAHVAARRPAHAVARRPVRTARCHAIRRHRCPAAARGAKPKPHPAPVHVTATTSATTTTSSTTAVTSVTSTAATSTSSAPVSLSTTTTTSTESSTLTTTAPAPARLQVVAKEYSFTLSHTSVPAGQVIIEYLNAGMDPHNLNFTPAGSGGAGTAAFGNTLPGEHPDQEFTFTPGSYTLFCSLPGHAAMGMMATLTVY